MNEKPGWKSTEFWMTLAGLVLGAFLSTQGGVSDAIILAMVGAGPAYGISRGLAKMKK